MNEFITNIVLSNSGYVIAMFIVLLLLSHLLVFPKNLSKRAWKKIDYIWLGVAAFGLLSLASDVRVSTAKFWSEMEHTQAVNSLENFREFYSSVEDSYLCMKFTRSDYSPDDFDELQRQHGQRCQWIKSVSNILYDLDINKLPSLAMDDFPKPNFEQGHLLKTVKEVEQNVTWYNEVRNKAIVTRNLLSKTDLERTLFYFSPFLLCLALSLRIAKVTGELRHEKT